MEAKAADVKACFGDGTNATDSVLFTLTNASKTNVLPAGFYGNFVRIRAVGANMWFFFTTSSGATIAASPTATDAGTQAANQGEYVPNGEIFHCWVPYPPTGGAIYFTRIGDAASQSVYVTKASGIPGRNTQE